VPRSRTAPRCTLGSCHDITHLFLSGDRRPGPRRSIASHGPWDESVLVALHTDRRWSRRSGPTCRRPGNVPSAPTVGKRHVGQASVTGPVDSLTGGGFGDCLLDPLRTDGRLPPAIHSRMARLVERGKASQGFVEVDVLEPLSLVRPVSRWSAPSRGRGCERPHPFGHVAPVIRPVRSAVVSRFVGGNDAGRHPPPVAHRHSLGARPGADCLRLPGRRDIGS
jgi:hypothetical protein